MHKQMNIYIYIDTHTHTLTTDPSAFALVGGLCSFGVLFLVFKGFEFEVLYGVMGFGGSGLGSTFWLVAPISSFEPENTNVKTLARV